MTEKCLSWSLLPMFVTLLAIADLSLCQGQGEEVYGSGGDCGDGNAAPMAGDSCAPVCDDGYVWCEEGRQCSPVDNGGYTCGCSPGYYENDVGSCQIGKYFGGRVYLKAGSVITRSICVDEASASEIINEIYNGSFGFQSATILGTNEADCYASYELVYQDSNAIDDAYIKSIYDNQTKNCTDAPDGLNCTASKEYVIDEGILCEDSSSFNDTCKDNAICSVTNGKFFCECKTPYVLPYPGATSCTEIRCEKDSDCSGGGIHGICNKVGANVADNFCQCNWGFTGETCEDPWWFVFTVLTGVFVVLVIVVLVACICMTTRTKTVKSEVQKDDLDLKNPFVDFQPGVRARVSTNIYSSVTDSISGQTTQGHSNPAFNNNTYDENVKGTRQGNDYF